MDGHIELALLQEWETSVLGAEPAALTPPPDEARQRVGKYEILDLIGKGAMGAVYRAFDPVLEREVALKVMLPRLADDPEHKRRFEREARAVARMSHPNVVTLFDLGYHTDGSPYIVMELLRGQDLLRSLRGSPALSLDRKLDILLQVLDGLGHAHRAGIVHRDIKPANVFIHERGAAKIMDFGVAHLPAGSGGTAGVVVGTANYMSPEQVLGGRVDGRSDLFSAACMLVEMLTGRPPFQAETAMSTIYRIAHQEPELTLPEGPLSERLRPLVLRALAKDPEARFATAEDFGAAIRGCLGRTAEAPPRADQAAPPPPAGRPSLPIPPPAGKPARPADPTGICELLREVHLASRSGHLHFSHADEHRSLRLVKGRIVHGTSDVPGEHLGDVLVRFGHLRQTDLERAVAAVLAQRRRLGAVLLEMGLIDPESLAAAVGEHVREILFSALERPDTRHLFEELPETAVEDDLTCELSTAEAILEATRRVHDPALIQQALGDLDRILVPARDPRLSSQKVGLSPTDGFVLSRVDGALTAREALSLVPGSPDDAARSLFGLLCTGLVSYRALSASRPVPAAPRRDREPVGAATPLPRSGPAPRDARPPVPAVPSPSRESAPSASPPNEAPPTPPTGQILRQMILSAYESLRYKDHFEFLDVPRAAGEAEIKDAYTRRVRVLHPDACRDPVVADLVTERSAVFARLCQAYETLRNPKAREVYERDIAPVKHRPSLPRKTSPPLSEPTPTGGTASEAAPRPTAVPPPVEPRVAVEVAAPEASPDDDDATTAAPTAFANAARLVKQEKYWDAIQLLEPAIPRLSGPLRQRARVLLAQAYLKNPHWSKRAEAQLQTVTSEDPRNVDAHFLLAGLYLKTHLEARAAAMFKKVLALQPDHPGAAAGLKALSTSRDTSFRLPFLKRA